jgi:hypothetical protein
MGSFKMVKKAKKKEEKKQPPGRTVPEKSA